MGKREYQVWAKDATFNWLNNSTALGGVVAMPTGTGKSHVIADIMQQGFEWRPQSRMSMFTHVKELIGQNLDKLKDAWPNAPVGVYSAGLKSKNMSLPIIFGGIASIIKVAEQLPPQDLAIIDECHLLNPDAEANAMYLRLVNTLQEKNKYVRIVGLTATWWRLGKGSIIDGKIFHEKIIDMTGFDAFNWFVAQGYLTKLITRPTETKIDLSGVGLLGSDYNQTEAAKAFDQQDITYRALQEACYYGQNRRKWLVFGTGIEHTEHITEMLNRMDISATCVHNKIPAGERDQRIKDYKAGKYRAMVNNNVLTTGFDDPQIDLIIMLRATMSPGLWVQMLGRGTRPFYWLGNYDRSILDTLEGRLWAMQMGGKHDCLVLDYGGNASRLGPINDPRIPDPKGKGTGDAPIKICKTDGSNLKHGVRGCGNYNHPSVRFCDICNAEFDFETKYTDKAFGDDVFSTDAPQVEWFDVSHIFYKEEIGPSGRPYLKVTYWSGKKKFTDTVFLGSEGYLLHKAKGWWAARFKVDNPSHPDNLPPTVTQAMPYCNGQWLREPKRIQVHVNKKPYPEIHHYEYE